MAERYDSSVASYEFFDYPAWDYKPLNKIDMRLFYCILDNIALISIFMYIYMYAYLYNFTKSYLG